MNDIALSQALQHSCTEVLIDGITLMDNHASAPGYILFASWNEGEEPTGKYYAYLTYLPHPEATIPIIFGFELTEQMDREGVKLAVMEAQDKFRREIKNLERMAREEIVNIQGADRDPVLWTGASLKHFGQTPFGQNLFRVVWAPTRLYLVGGRWTDRVEGKITRTVDEYRWIQRYGEEQNGWVLEKWLSAKEYAGPKELWIPDEVKGLYELGPYPSRGEYESCWTFPSYPQASYVEDKIRQLLYGKNHFNVADIRKAHRDVLEGKKLDSEAKLEDMIRDAIPAFPTRAMSGFPYRSAPIDKKISTNNIPHMPDANEFKQIN
jgi:hypothetical protein